MRQYLAMKGWFSENTFCIRIAVAALLMDDLFSMIQGEGGLDGLATIVVTREVSSW